MLRRLLLGSAIALLATAAVGAQDTAGLRGQFTARETDSEIGRAQAMAAKADIERLKAELEALKAIRASGGGDTAANRARLEEIHRREAEVDAEMGRNQVQLARLLGALQLYGRSPPPALLVHPKSATDAVRAAILIHAMEPELAARARAYQLRSERIEVLRKAAAAANEELFTSESSLADRTAELESLLAETSAAQRRFDAEAEAAKRDADSLGSRLRALGVPLPGASAADRGPSTLLPPVEGTLIRRFGDRSPGGQRSAGFAWRTGRGELVKSPASGVVEYAGPLKGWGGVLILRLGGGYHLVVAGLDATSGTAGRFVNAGGVLGRMAADREPELYLEVRKDGAPVDPARWLRPSSLARADGRSG